MNFSAVPRRRLIGRLLRAPLSVLPPDACVPIMQGRLRGKKWITGSSSHGCWLGSYELHKRRVFERVVRQGSVVFDLGANVGYYTLLASTLVGKTGQVIAFEPLPRNIDFLRRHLSLNKIANVSVIEAAVADRGGEAKFEEGPSACEGHLANNGKTRVMQVSLDELMDQGRIPLPDYLKVDVEGAEALVLAGARGLLERRRTAIFLSLHGPDLRRQCYAILRPLDYTLQPLDSDQVALASEVLASPASSFVTP